jgi:hypothetical protein
MKKKGKPAYWKEYKTGRLQGIYYGAFFQDNLSLTNWINSQNLGKTIYCLGDGHDGVWNLFSQVADHSIRQEILDWYHLKENLYKIEAPKQFLEQIKNPHICVCWGFGAWGMGEAVRSWCRTCVEHLPSWGMGIFFRGKGKGKKGKGMELFKNPLEYLKLLLPLFPFPFNTSPL